MSNAKIPCYVSIIFYLSNMNCLAMTFDNNSLVDLWDDERLECKANNKFSW